MSMEIQDYEGGRKYETFSYLPEMSADQVRAQIAYALRQGWSPSIEHTEPERSMSHYWYMWKLPMFGEQSVDNVLAELEACRRKYPNHLIKLVAYDNYAQTMGLAFVVYRG